MSRFVHLPGIIAVSPLLGCMREMYQDILSPVGHVCYILKILRYYECKIAFSVFCLSLLMTYRSLVKKNALPFALVGLGS